MPEGHTIHRAARLQSKRFGGETVEAWSPQGRFTAGAARIDGERLESIEAHGKHLFYQWSTGEVLHVHLGLFGRFRIFATDPPPPTDGTRLAWTAATGTMYLAGATTVELIDPDRQAQVLRRLGPDPLKPHPDAVEAFGAALSRRTVPIGAALLDQKAVAGLGNVYRAELLYLAGIDPARPAKSLSRGEVQGLWDLAVRQLRLGERSGRIITVDAADVGRRRRSDLRRGQRLYVYKRDGRECRRCGAEIGKAEMGGRSIWWCPSCQDGSVSFG